MPFYTVLDTETSGLDNPIKVVELAWVQIDEELNVVSEFTALVNPGRAIHPGAQAIHGISDDDVKDAPPLETVIADLKGVELVAIGHNVSFDLRVIGDHLDLVGSVCTLALSRQYYPKAPNHKLGTMQEYLGLPSFEAHRALGDVYTSLNVLKRILHDHNLTLPQVVKRQEKPRMLLVMPYGKHKGTPILQVPRDYREWLLRAGNLDQDLLYTLQRTQSL